MEPLFYLVTDLHIDDSCTQLLKESLCDIFEDMKKNSQHTLVVSGDIFNFRKSQTLTTLVCWREVLDIAYQLGIHIIAIPGNHDKMSYQSEDSYLDLFELHPGFSLIKDYGVREFDGLDVHFIPFFDEKTTYSKYLDLIPGDISENSILITHVAINGVRNNDGSEVSGSLPTEVFSRFRNVFVGHYHDRQFVGDNIVYIGSIMQRNFGEDANKGYVKVFQDGSYEFVQKEYQIFETIKLTYSDTLVDDLEKIEKMEVSDSIRVRVVLNGTKEELDSLKSLDVVKKLESSGFMLRNDYVSIESVELDSAESFTPFTKTSLLTEWEEFSQLNTLNKETGLIVLKTFLNV